MNTKQQKHTWHKIDVTLLINSCIAIQNMQSGSEGDWKEPFIIIHNFRRTPRTKSTEHTIKKIPKIIPAIAVTTRRMAKQAHQMEPNPQPNPQNQQYQLPELIWHQIPQPQELPRPQLDDPPNPASSNASEDEQPERIADPIPDMAPRFLEDGEPMPNNRNDNWFNVDDLLEIEEGDLLQ